MDAPEFRRHFGHSIHRADRLQPALLVAWLLSTSGFAATGEGTARALAAIAIAGLVVMLVGSAAYLVPLQRRLLAAAGLATGRGRRSRPLR